MRVWCAERGGGLPEPGASGVGPLLYQTPPRGGTLPGPSPDLPIPGEARRRPWRRLVCSISFALLADERPPRRAPVLCREARAATQWFHLPHVSLGDMLSDARLREAAAGSFVVPRARAPSSTRVG